jgi:hypothetical protein
VADHGATARVFTRLQFDPYLWKKGKKATTHLQHFPEFTQLQAEVDRALLHFAQAPHAIMALMARSWESLGAMAV